MIQRFFDVADEIDLAAAEARVTHLLRRSRFAGSAQTIHLPNPPLEMFLGQQRLPGELGSGDAVVRLYDIGAVVVTFMVDITPGTSGEQLVKLAAHIAALEEELTAAARTVVEEVRSNLSTAFVSKGIGSLVEDYTLFYIRNFDKPCLASEVEQHIDIPRLLAADLEPLANQERRELTNVNFSYRPDDLVVVDWNSALVVDPTYVTDVPEVLELTTVHMLELRVYDHVIGRALDGVYKELEVESVAPFRSSRYRRLSRQIMRLVVDITEITERVDNSFTFIGDSWLARLHRAAVVEFGTLQWQRQLRNRMEVLRQINTLLVDQITAQKSYNVEVVIVLLIFTEILMAILMRH